MNHRRDECLKLRKERENEALESRIEGRKRLQPPLKNTSFRRVISSRFLLPLRNCKNAKWILSLGKADHILLHFETKRNSSLVLCMCKYMYIIHTRDILNGCAKLWYAFNIKIDSNLYQRVTFICVVHWLHGNLEFVYIASRFVSVLISIFFF